MSNHPVLPPSINYMVPGGAYAAVMTGRSELARIEAGHLRTGDRGPLSVAEQAGLLDLVADLVSNAEAHRAHLRGTLVQINALQATVTGLETIAEKIAIAVEACGVSR